LELRNVGYRAGQHQILADVSWNVAAGEHWALLGPNGAGKTTLLRIACGYLWPNAGGEVLRRGEARTDLRQLRKSMGWVSHRLAAGIPPREPALETVVSGRRAEVGLKHWAHLPEPAPEDLTAAQQLLVDLDCGQLADRPFGVLSQGEQQKVLIARAMMSLPLLIFLDEPCAGLDPGAREHFLHDLQGLAARSTLPSLILVTHHIEEIMPAFAQLLVMNQGAIVYRGSTREAIDTEMLQHLYGVQVHDMIRRDGRIWPVF
jgi:iron complex transport system ATP-binding protein